MPQAIATTAASAMTSASALSARMSSHMRASQDFHAKRGEIHPRLLRRHRHEAVSRHAGRRIDLEERPRAIGAQDQIEAAPAAATDDAKRRQRLRLDRLLDVGGYAARAEIPGLVGKILVVIVVVSLGRLDPYEGQRALVENRSRQLDAGDEFLGYDEVVVLGGSAKGKLELAMIDLRDAGKTYGRSLARRLDDQRQSKLGDNRPPVRPGIDDAKARCGNFACDPDELSAPLVHRQSRGHHTAAGVRHAEYLERTLDGSVFAETPVQGDERALETLALELEKRALRRIERVRVDPLALQRREHGVAGEKRDFSFRRRAAHQHRHLPEFTHAPPALASSRSAQRRLAFRLMPPRR